MPSPLQLRFAALAALLALTGACSDSSTGPSVDPVNLSQALAELQPTSIAPVADQLSAVPAASIGAPNPSSCSYDGASKSFVCPNVTVTGVTVSRSFTLLDANAAPQTAFDPATTAAVRLKTAIAGTVTSGASTIAVDQQQDLTLSGLLTGVHMLNGTSLVHMTGSAGSGTTTVPVNMTISATVTNLVLPRASRGEQWPQSGTIAATVTDASSGTARTGTIAVGFNGTSKATLTVTVDGLSVSTTIDLTNPGSIRG